MEKNKIKSKNNLVLTDKEKDLLKDYLISDFEDSYSTILASEINNTDRITSKKLQVILEFLFFIRDKTSAIIHSLNEASSLFFQFLNQYSFKKSIDKNEIKEETKNEISDDDEEEDEYSDEDDDDYGFDMEELKKEFNNKSSKNYEKDNQKLFNNLISEIGCFSALDYIFSNNPYYDYEKEINYFK